MVPMQVVKERYMLSMTREQKKTMKFNWVKKDLFRWSSARTSAFSGQNFLLNKLFCLSKTTPQFFITLYMQLTVQQSALWETSLRAHHTSITSRRGFPTRFVVAVSLRLRHTTAISLKSALFLADPGNVKTVLLLPLKPHNVQEPMLC